LESKPVAVNFSVDLIRFLAIFLIILLHCSGAPYRFINPEITTLDIANWFTTEAYGVLGMAGVPLFVMLTGALLLNPAKADEPLRVFYKKRFGRIALPFIFWTVVYFAWAFLVHEREFSAFNVAQGLVDGSYAHLWYLYLLIGLYAVTPIFRILVKHIDRNLFTYLLVIWFVGTVGVPIIHSIPNLRFNPVGFVFLDWIGYYLLGIYLLKANVRRSTVNIVAVLGLVGAFIGDWLITGTLGEQYTGYFSNYMSATIIMGTAALFFILVNVDPRRIESHAKINKVIHWVSQNTLAIFMIHMIVLETFTLGFLGFYVNKLTFIALVDVLVFTLIIFGVSVALVFVLKKIPYVSKLIG